MVSIGFKFNKSLAMLIDLLLSTTFLIFLMFSSPLIFAVIVIILVTSRFLGEIQKDAYNIGVHIVQQVLGPCNFMLLGETRAHYEETTEQRLFSSAKRPSS